MFSTHTTLFKILAVYVFGFSVECATFYSDTSGNSFQSFRKGQINNSLYVSL